LRLDKFQDTLIGHSQIAAPFRGAIKKLEYNHEEMFIQKVDIAILKEAEKTYKIKNDLKNRIY
jgi:predicted amidohydrolase